MTMTDIFTKKDILAVAAEANIFEKKRLVMPIKCIGILLSDIALMLPSGQQDSENFDKYSKEASQLILAQCPEIRLFLKKFKKPKELTQEIVEAMPGYEDLPELYNVTLGTIKKVGSNEKRKQYGSFFNINEDPKKSDPLTLYQSGQPVVDTHNPLMVTGF